MFHDPLFHGRAFGALFAAAVFLSPFSLAAQDSALLRSISNGEDRRLEQLFQQRPPEQHELNEALFYAVEINAAEKVVALLLRQGANSDALNDERQTPLLVALTNFSNRRPTDPLTPRRRAIAGLLLAASSNVAHPGPDGDTVLHILARRGEVELLHRALASPTAVDSRGALGRTPLINAALAGHVPAIRALVAAGANVNLRTDSGETALGAATQEQHVNCARTLLELGASVDPVDAEGNTPLVTAVQARHLPLIQLLIQRGASIERMNLAGQNAWGLAQKSSDADLRAAVLGPSEELLRELREAGRILTVKALLSKGARTNVLDPRGETPLVLAVRGRHEGSVEVLLQAGANPNDNDRDGVPVLHQAAKNRDLPSIKSLVQHGANVERRDPAGRTAADVCISRGYNDALLVLRSAAKR